MITYVTGIQVINVRIKKECRELHGKHHAFQLAINIIKEKYYSTVKSEVNKDATFNLCLTVDRDV